MAITTLEGLPVMMKLEYRTGGNPPVIEGVYIVDPMHHPKLVAFWPAGYPVNDTTMQIVYNLVINREDEQPIPRQILRQAFRRAEVFQAAFRKV